MMHLQIAHIMATFAMLAASYEREVQALRADNTEAADKEASYRRGLRDSAELRGIITGEVKPGGKA